MGTIAIAAPSSTMLVMMTFLSAGAGIALLAV